jgi:hypothetical protein
MFFAFVLPFFTLLPTMFFASFYAPFFFLIFSIGFFSQIFSALHKKPYPNTSCVVFSFIYFLKFCYSHLVSIIYGKFRFFLVDLWQLFWISMGGHVSPMFRLSHSPYVFIPYDFHLYKCLSFYHFPSLVIRHLFDLDDCPSLLINHTSCLYPSPSFVINPRVDFYQC